MHRFDECRTGEPLSSEQGICHLTDAPDVPEPWEHQRREIDHTPLGFDPIDIPAYRALIIWKMISISSPPSEESLREGTPWSNRRERIEPVVRDAAWHVGWVCGMIQADS